MKRFLPAISAALFFAFAVLAQPVSGDIQLEGILDLPGVKYAALVVDGELNRGHSLVMREGEKHEAIEVVEINPASGTVKLKEKETSLDLHFQGASGSKAAPGDLQLVNMHTGTLLKLYAQLTERTVLRAELPDGSYTLTAAAGNKAEAALVLANALKQKGITIIPDGDRFVKVIKSSDVKTALARSAWIKMPQVESENAMMKSGKRGDVFIPNVTVTQVLPIYAAIVRAKGIEKDDGYFRLPPITISLESQTPLSQKEATYAFDTVFSWYGFKLVPAENDLIKVVWLP